jgi:hypothetical protein
MPQHLTGSGNCPIHGPEKIWPAAPGPWSLNQTPEFALIFYGCFYSTINFLLALAWQTDLQNSLQLGIFYGFGCFGNIRFASRPKLHAFLWEKTPID